MLDAETIHDYKTSQFARFNNNHKDTEKFYNKITKLIGLKEHTEKFILVEHIGDELKHEHTHFIIFSNRDIPLKTTRAQLQQTQLRKEFEVTGRSQSYVKETKNRENAIIYMFKGMMKHKGLRCFSNLTTEEYEYWYSRALKYEPVSVEKTKDTTDKKIKEDVLIDLRELFTKQYIIENFNNTQRILADVNGIIYFEYQRQYKNLPFKKALDYTFNYPLMILQEQLDKKEHEQTKMLFDKLTQMRWAEISKFLKYL